MDSVLYCYLGIVAFLASLNHFIWVQLHVLPEQLIEAALIHDDQTYQTFSSIMGLDESDPGSWFQSCLPIRHEGFGLSRMQSVAPMVFLAAWAQTSRELSLRLNSHELIDNFFERQPCEGSLSLSLSHTHTHTHTHAHIPSVTSVGNYTITNAKEILIKCKIPQSNS